MSETTDTSASIYGQCISEAEYFKVEETAKERHEYVAGLTFAMNGASGTHNILINNLFSELRKPVRDSSCRAYTIDMRVYIASLQSYYYPDLIVTCEKHDPATLFVVSPCLIVEVLSPSTESVDRREKLQAYRTIPSIREYLLVHQDKVWIELFRKDDSQNWQLSEFKNGSTLSLSSLPCGALDLNIDDIYEGLEL